MSDDNGTAQPVDDLQSWMVARLAERLQVPPAEIDVTRPVMQFGLDSIVAFSLTGELADRIGYDLPATLFWDYPTLEAIAKYLTDFVRSAEAPRREPLQLWSGGQHPTTASPAGG